MLHLTPALQCSTQGHHIRIFQVAANRQAARRRAIIQGAVARSEAPDVAPGRILDLPRQRLDSLRRIVETKREEIRDYFHAITEWEPARAAKYGIELPDRQLCAAPLGSDEARRYFAQMACAVNYAFANRQLITDRVRSVVEQVLRVGPADHGVEIVV